MPFGNYANKAVQGMTNLFNAPAATSMYRKAGYIGSKGVSGGDPFSFIAGAVGRDARAIRAGKTRVGFGVGGALALGSQSRSSGGGRGLQPRSSAPMAPPNSPSPYGGY